VRLRRTLTGLTFAATIACSNVEPDTINDLTCPPLGDPAGTDPLAAFRPVSSLLEQRCGTLDCHGQEPRPLKIYGRVGLRAPDSNVDDPDGGYYAGGELATTDYEIEQNFRSVCGLEPEKTAEVLAREREPDELTLIRKPKLFEKHKGGRVWDNGKPGDRCLKLWTQGAEIGEYAALCLEEVN
jgi:hypothetical protein